MPQLVDVNGQPFKMANLKTPQTAAMSHLPRLFAEHPASGLTPQRLKQILRDAEGTQWARQFELFEDMEERWAHLFAEMDKRKRRVMGLEWEIRAPEEANQDDTDLSNKVSEAYKGIPNFSSVVFSMLDATGKGFAPIERVWGYQDGMQLPRQHWLRPQWWFTTDADTRSKVLLRSQSAKDGEELINMNWLVHRHAATPGNVAVSALYRVIAYTFMLWAYAKGDHAEFNHKHGMPIPVGKYPSGSTDAEKSTLLKAVTSLGHGSAGIMPDTMLVELMEAVNASSEPFMAMSDWAEKEASKAINHGTLTTQADGKSSTNALGNVHKDGAHDVTKADAVEAEETLHDQLTAPIVFLNFGKVPKNRLPRLVFDTREKEDITVWSDALPKILASGVDIGEDQGREIFNIRALKPGEKPLKATFAAVAPAASSGDPATTNQPATKPGAAPGTPAGKAPASDKKVVNIRPAATLRALFDTIAGEPGGAAALARAQVDPGPSTEYSEQLARVAAPAMAETLKALRQIVDDAPDLATLQQMLVAGFGDLPRDELVQVMGLAYAVADLAGRADVLNGNLSETV